MGKINWKKASTSRLVERRKLEWDKKEVEREKKETEKEKLAHIAGPDYESGNP